MSNSFDLQLDDVSRFSLGAESEMGEIESRRIVAVKEQQREEEARLRQEAHVQRQKEYQERRRRHWAKALPRHHHYRPSWRGQEILLPSKIETALVRFFDPALSIIQMVICFYTVLPAVMLGLVAFRLIGRQGPSFDNAMDLLFDDGKKPIWSREVFKAKRKSYRKLSTVRRRRLAFFFRL